MRVGKRVLTVGDINIDIILSGMRSLPEAERETLASGMDIVVGGQTGTIARALSALGWDVGFVGRVGDDEYGRKAVLALTEAGVDASGVVVDRSARTGATVVLSTGRQRAYATFTGAVSSARASDVTSAMLSRADHIHVGSYFLQKALRPDLPALFEKARQRGLTTSLDPGWDPANEWGKDLREALPAVDVFLPNEAEAIAISGARTAEDALAFLAAFSRIVVVKRGAEGCIAAHRFESLRCPGFAVETADVTSAGDIFNAGFLHGFLSGWELAQSMKHACACGALSVSRVGSAGIMAGGEEVERFLAERGSEITVTRIQTGGRK